MLKRFCFLVQNVLFLILQISVAGYGQTPSVHPVHQGASMIPIPLEAEFCTTISLWDEADSRAAMQEFRAWKAKGRPGQFELHVQSDFNIGDRRNFFVRNFRDNRYDSEPFELRGKGNMAFIWVERDQIGANKFTDAMAAEMLEFLEDRTGPQSINPENGIFAINRELFGEAPNVDGSGRVHVLVTNIKGPEEGFTIGGYFAPINLSLTNPNSNRADIIYINSLLFFNDNGPRPLQGALSTLAHEDQHLIHANYGTLPIFQNEGQSEWSEIANGFPGRFASHLFLPEQLNVPLYQWRGTDVQTLYDYSRASLLHNYIADRVGPELTGNITSSERSFLSAYQPILNALGTTFPEFIMDFHTANLINDPQVGDGRFSYTTPTRRSLRSTGFAEQYQPIQVSTSASSSVQYGGVEKRIWYGVRDFTIELEASADVRQRLVAKTLFSSEVQVQDVTGNSIVMEGDFENVVLISSKTSISTGSEESSPPASYQYSAIWDPLPVEVRQLRYHQSPAFLAELPGDPNDQTRSNFLRYATRISPVTSGELSEIGFQINNGAQSVRGSGTLRVSVHRGLASGTTQGGTRYIPGEELLVRELQISQINRGRNIIGLSGSGLEVQADEEYMIVFEVTNPSPDARVEFLLDNGSDNSNNTDYYPARSLLFVAGTTNDWRTWSSNNNYVVDATVTGMYDGPIVEPMFTTLPSENYVAAKGSNLEIRVQASGTPVPIFIWQRNGQTLPSQSGPTLRLNNISDSDAGTYTVRASNFGGFTDLKTFTVDVVPEGVTLAQNFPNPFNNSTNISFTLSERGRVDLEVFDALGRRVQRLTTTDIYEPGSYQIPFDATMLASGAYMYRLYFRPVSSGSSDVSMNGKMMLLK